MPCITKEIKKFGIYLCVDEGEYVPVNPKHIIFFNSGKQFKCYGFKFNTIKDLNTKYFISQEEL